MKHLFCDCKTDEEKANFFLSGRAVETGIVASAISNDVAMAYHRCAEFQKEIDALRAKIAEMERQDLLYLFRRKGLDDFCTCSKERYEAFSANPRLFEVKTLYALPGAQTQGEGK